MDFDPERLGDGPIPKKLKGKSIPGKPTKSSKHKQRKKSTQVEMEVSPQLSSTEEMEIETSENIPTIIITESEDSEMCSAGSPMSITIQTDSTTAPPSLDSAMSSSSCPLKEDAPAQDEEPDSSQFEYHYSCASDISNGSEPAHSDGSISGSPQASPQISPYVSPHVSPEASPETVPATTPPREEGESLLADVAKATPPKPEPQPEESDVPGPSAAPQYVTDRVPLVDFLRLTPRLESPEEAESLAGARFEERAESPRVRRIDLKHVNLHIDDYDTVDTYMQNYTYCDSEDILRELAEFYSYSEERTYNAFRKVFENVANDLSFPTVWKTFSDEQKINLVKKLLNKLKSDKEETRIRAAKCILYIAQGSWANVAAVNEHTSHLLVNGFLLYDMGVFCIFIDLLRMEADKFHETGSISMRSSNFIMVCFNVLYAIVEVMRCEKYCSVSPCKKVVASFCSDLLRPYRGDLFIVTLFDLLVRFTTCKTESKNFPLKKLLLLLWKLILLSLGSLEDLEVEKNKKREKWELPPIDDESRKKPKVHQEAFNNFLTEAREARAKDSSGVVDLSGPISDSIDILAKHLYVPLSYIEIERERLVTSNPFRNQDQIDDTPTETLYRALFPRLDKYLLSLMKILPFIINNRGYKRFSKPKIKGVSTGKNARLGDIYNAVLTIDSCRYEEIILKAVSGILLLLLKHTKLNHIYQFEYICRLLEGYNAITFLVLLFNEDVLQYVHSVNDIIGLDFSTHLVTCGKGITKKQLTLINENTFSRRNIFTCINLLRILVKLINRKDYRARTLTFRTFATNLKKCFEIEHRMMKLYAAKVFKNLFRHSNANWRTRTISLLGPVYKNVRLHLNDDFLVYKPPERGNGEEETKEEKQLRFAISIFNNRRYSRLVSLDNEHMPCCAITFTRTDPSESWPLPYQLQEAFYQWLDRRYLS